MSRIASTLILRPSTSADLVVVAGCHYDLPLSSTSSIQHEPPSEYETTRLVKQRVRTHFKNDGKIELDGINRSTLGVLSFILYSYIGNRLIVIFIRSQSYLWFILHYSVHVDEPCTLVYVCVAEPSLGHVDAQTFLDKVKGVVLNDTQLIMLIPQSSEHELQPHLDQPLSALMMAENTAPNPQQQKMDAMRQQVDSVKTVMAQNVEAIMQRGERLDNIEQRTEDLQATSANFKMTAHRVQRQYCLKNAKWTVITVIVTLLVLTAIILLILNACGVFDKK